MNNDQQKLLMEVHTAVCGVGGRGGLIERVNNLELTEKQRAKTLGIAAGVGAVAGWLAGLFKN